MRPMRCLPLVGLLLIFGCARPSEPAVQTPAPVVPKVYKSPTVTQPPREYPAGNPTGIGTPPFHEDVPSPAPSIVGRWSMTSAGDGSNLLIEFRPDGSASSLLKTGGSELKFNGSYTMNGRIGSVNLKSETPQITDAPPGSNTTIMTIQIALAPDGKTFKGDGSNTFTRL